MPLVFGSPCFAVQYRHLRINPHPSPTQAVPPLSPSPGEPARGSEGGSEAGEEYGERRFVEHGEDVLHEGDVSLHEGESDEEAVASGGLRAGAARRGTLDGGGATWGVTVGWWRALRLMRTCRVPARGCGGGRHEGLCLPRLCPDRTQPAGGPVSPLALLCMLQPCIHMPLCHPPLQ